MSKGIVNVKLYHWGVQNGVLVVAGKTIHPISLWYSSGVGDAIVVEEKNAKAAMSTMSFLALCIFEMLYVRKRKCEMQSLFYTKKINRKLLHLLNLTSCRFVKLICSTVAYFNADF